MKTGEVFRFPPYFSERQQSMQHTQLQFMVTVVGLPLFEERNEMENVKSPFCKEMTTKTEFVFVEQQKPLIPQRNHRFLPGGAGGCPGG